MCRSKLIFLLAVFISPANAQELCTYQTYSWNTIKKEAVNYETVKKPYAELTADEVDAYTGCSVCEQDQRIIDLPPLKPFKICHIMASRLTRVLEDLLRQGEPVNSVIGYRVGKTRGEIDGDGKRTGFSNHSFGVAVDINPEQNGLYDKCTGFSQSCRLIRGGPWNPENEGSLKADGAIVGAMEDLGLKWGGQISGRQKDFMHFSPTGY